MLNAYSTAAMKSFCFVSESVRADLSELCDVYRNDENPNYN